MDHEKEIKKRYHDENAMGFAVGGASGPSVAGNILDKPGNSVNKPDHQPKGNRFLDKRRVTVNAFEFKPGMEHGWAHTGPRYNGYFKTLSEADQAREEFSDGRGYVMPHYRYQSADFGDWIIENSDGGLEVMTAEKFRLTFEPIAEPPRGGI